MEAEEWGATVAVGGLNPNGPVIRRRHINKRALRNKALSVGFNDKDLRDFVTGFHKRKKKRRKVAQKQLEEKERLKRIEARKKRKLEREFALYGEALPVDEPPETGSGPDIDGDEHEEDLNKTQSVSGTKLYDNGDMTITVTTSELSRGDEDLRATHFIPKPSIGAEKNKSLLAKKKPLKRVTKQRSRKKHQKAAIQNKGKRKGRNK